MRAEIDAKADGSGFVRAAVGLDEEATTAAADLAAQLRVDDLRQSGWTVTGPARDSGGLTWVRASKPFESAEQATAIMAELSGPAGPLRDFVLRHDRSLVKTRTEFSGLVDLSGGTSGFVDADLRAKLGDAFSLDDKAFRFEVEANVPGASRTWRPVVGEQTPLELSSDSWRLVPVIPASVALLCATAATVLLIRRRH